MSEKQEYINNIVRNFEKNIPDLLIPKFKKDSICINEKVRYILDWLDNTLKTRNLLIWNQILAYYSYYIKNDVFIIYYIETINASSNFDYEENYISDKFQKLPWLGKNMILDIILKAWEEKLSKIKFIHILSDSEWFYEKICNYLLENQFIEKYYCEYEDIQDKSYKNLVLEI